MSRAMRQRATRATGSWLRALGSLALVAGAGAASAHGNLSMEADFCKLRVGRYVVHFTGYLPEGQAATKEFCEDIPATGRALIVLDYVDPELRDLPVAFRIVEADGPENRTVVDVPARLYPNGTVSVEHRFEQAGRFVGIVSVKGGAEQVARFPFSVGASRGAWHYAVGAALALAALAGLYLFGQRQRHRVAAPR